MLMDKSVLAANAEKLYYLSKAILWRLEQMGNPVKLHELEELDYLLDRMASAQPGGPAIDSNQLWRDKLIEAAPF